ncbi:MAG: hypothetical protein GY710_13560 [Desulfobacteraceae bacterium]|nr:hypothetical protein [Desulfobacteraceae bacterium]
MFATPLGWVVLLIKKLVGSWDSLKATFMDSSWGQAIMGWLDKILGSFNLLSKGWDWVSDKLSWVPGFGKDSEDVPKSSPYLDAPKKLAVQPGGAAKSISNAVTNNSRADSRTTHIGQIVSSKPINSPEITNMLYGAGA